MMVADVRRYKNKELKVVDLGLKVIILYTMILIIYHLFIFEKMAEKCLTDLSYFMKVSSVMLKVANVSVTEQVSVFFRIENTRKKLVKSVCVGTFCSFS